MQEPWRHLPFGLVVFLVLVLALTIQAVSGEFRVYVTLLAPILWLGLYWLWGSERAEDER